MFGHSDGGATTAHAIHADARISDSTGGWASRPPGRRRCLASYLYLSAARAEFLRRLHPTDDARLAYHEARLLADNPIEQAFLTRRLDELDR